MSTLADRVREQRESMGWQKKDLAHRAGVHPSHITSIESGARLNLRVDTVAKLAAALGVTERWLVHGVDDSTKGPPDDYAAVIGFARENGIPPGLLLDAARLLAKARA